jgi:HEAT repeat protein
MRRRRSSAASRLPVSGPWKKRKTVTHTAHFARLIFLQAAGWRLDLLSLLIGVLIGGLLAYAAIRWLPNLLAWRDRLVVRVRETQAWVRSGVESRYQAETAEYIRHHHLDGQTVHLDQIFVAPYLMAPQLEIEAEAAVDLGPSQLYYLWPELASHVAVPPVPAAALRQLLLKGRRVVISAEPGAGKSTLLAYCAYLCASATDMGPYVFLLPMMPVFVHLGDLDLIPAGSQEGESGPDASPLIPLIRVLQQRTSPLTSRGVGDLLRQKAVEGQALLLLDGLDEVPGAGRAQAVEWLQRLLADYPKIRAILAAPLRGCGPLLAMGFIQSGVLPWRLGQAEAYGGLWQETPGRPARIPVHAYWQPGQAILETSLRLGLARQSDSVDPSEPPRRRVELMEITLRGLLPQPIPETDPPWLVTATRELWQLLAYRFLESGLLSLPREAVLAAVSQALQDYDVEEDRTASQRLFGTLTGCSLFDVGERQQVRFLSPVWRDYLATSYLIAQPDVEETMLAHLDDPYWSGVLRFYIGRTGAGQLAPVLLQRQDPLNEDLFRVASWLPEALDDGEWRRQTLIRLGQMVIKESLPLSLRQRAAVALALTGESGVLVFLRQLLRQREPYLRQVALATMPRLGSEVAIDVAEKMVADSEVGVRVAAVHSLAWIHDPATEKPLLTALLEPDEPMNRAAAEGLALTGNQEAFELLREAIVEEELHIRRAAVLGLALLDQYWSVELLDRVEREDEQWVVRSAANSALEAIVDRNQPGLWQIPEASDHGWLISWAATQGRAVPSGAGGMPVLLEALVDPADPSIRVTAALTLGRLVVHQAMPELRKALGRRSAGSARRSLFCLVPDRPGLGCLDLWLR